VIHPATTNEILIDLPVSAGQLVEKGQVIAKFDAELQQAIVAKAQAQLAQATAFLEKTLNGARPEEVAAASAKVAAANAAYTQSEANFRRAKTLVKDKLASQETLDSATAARDETFANLESAKQNLNELTNGSRVEDINSAKAQVQAAEAELKVQQKYLSDLTIKAMRAGRVDNLPWHVGERVTKGSPVVIIQANSAPCARVYIPEPYRAKLNQGMTLTVRVDGIDKDIQGELTWIATEPAFTPFYALNQEERARLMYLAEVTLPTSENNLPTGVPAQVIMP
jgi:HlyD family secretion protein